MTNINNVILQGVIVHKFVTPKIAIITINTGNATPTPNYPKVLFFGELRDKVENMYKRGDKVNVIGNIQSSKRRPDIKNQATVNIFGEDIKPATSLMEKAFGVESNTSYVPYINQIEVAGTVMSIESPVYNIVRLRVKTIKNEHPSFIPLVHFTQDAEAVLDKIHPMDEVYIVGDVQTTKKEKEKEIHHYENYVATEITKKNS